MPRFEKVETSRVDFPAQERAVLEFWRTTDAFGKLREKNRGKPKWSFLDGPITANNPMGVHHAWGRTYKDAYQRYFAMTGHELRYQNGFDCQGLWVEVEVEKSLGLRSKRDIEELVPGDRDASVAKFVDACKARVNEFARVQTEQSIRLGYWMDWDTTDADWAKSPDERKSYFTMSEENNYTIWAFLKKCHERGLVYRGFDAMPWCPRCGVGISQMEMNEGYRVVAHRAVFVRFPLRDRPGENLLAWTTTPWTLTSNVAAAVNSELAYLKVRQGDQIYYVGKGAFAAKRKEDEFKDKSQWVEGVPKLKTLEQFFKEKKGGFEVLGEVKGADLVGWAYDGPFDDLPAQSHPAGYPRYLSETAVRQGWTPEGVSAREAHRVVAWADVSEAEGTGIVHIAPGCGAEDFALGKTVGLPPVAPLTESGQYLDGFGDLTGKNAVDPETADWVVAQLQSKGLLFATEKYPHRYPHCWRCKTELLYRLVDEWFISMSWRQEIIDTLGQVKWLPEAINGHAREQNWLENMGDWMISKKRYWGLALPVWVDPETREFEVIGSREELRARAVEGWDEFAGHTPHRPWIDKIKIRNPTTGNLMARVPDVGNPWLDAGIVPFSTLGYNKDQEHWKQWFPADFVTESFPGQFRNWFYALLTMSAMMAGRAPFKMLLGHGLVRDEAGEEMHKSKGNSIEFNTAAEQLGADVCRWLYCRSNPAANIAFGSAPANDVRARFVLKLWNVYGGTFVNNARAAQGGFDTAAPEVPVSRRSDLDRWILSDLQLLVKLAHESFRSFDVMRFCLEAERFVDDKLSNWYVRRNRRRMDSNPDDTDRLAAYQTLYAVLTTFVKLIAPVVPFLTETMWQNLRLTGDAESVHLCDFPVADEALIDAELSAEVEALLRLVSLGGAARNAAKAKVRQPLAELRIQPGSEVEQRAATRFADQLRDELNVKRVTLHDGAAGPLLSAEIRANLKSLGQKAGAQLQAAKKQLEAMDPAEFQARTANGPFALELPGGAVEIAAADATVTVKAPDGFAGAADKSTQVMLDARITPELAAEGVARDVVRQVQDSRKNADLQMEDRIVLHLGTTSDKLREAIDAHREFIAAETLATAWSETNLDGYSADVKVDGQALTIGLKKVE